MEEYIYKELLEKISFLNENHINENIVLKLKKILEENKFYNIKISSRIKDVKSATLKYNEKNYSNIDEIQDLIGIMIICRNKKQVYKISECLKENLNVIKVSDYIKKPKMGYKSLHLNITDAPNIIYEIQLKTKPMMIAQDIIHDKIYKNKTMPMVLKKILSIIVFNTVKLYEEILNWINN